MRVRRQSNTQMQAHLGGHVDWEPVRECILVALAKVGVDRAARRILVSIAHARLACTPAQHHWRHAVTLTGCWNKHSTLESAGRREGALSAPPIGMLLAKR